MTLVGDPVMSKWIIVVLGISVALNGFLLKGIAAGTGLSTRGSVRFRSRAGIKFHVPQAEEEEEKVKEEPVVCEPIGPVVIMPSIGPVPTAPAPAPVVPRAPVKEHVTVDVPKEPNPQPACRLEYCGCEAQEGASSRGSSRPC